MSPVDRADRLDRVDRWRFAPDWVGIAVATGARRVLAARGEVVFGVVVYGIIIGAITTLWRVAAEANGGTVDGYDALALTWYLATSEAAYMAVNSRLIEDIGDDLAGGAVVSEMLRPVPVVGVRLADQFGAALPRLAAHAVVGTVICLVLVGAPPAIGALLLAAPSMVLAVACNLMAVHAFAAITFWLRDARSAWFLYQKLIFIFGGMLLPLQVLPDWLQAVALRLPFMAMAYAPARLAAGHVEPHLLAVQVGWLVALGGLAVAVFNAGERRLQAVGG